MIAIVLARLNQEHLSCHITEPGSDFIAIMMNGTKEFHSDTHAPWVFFYNPNNLPWLMQTTVWNSTEPTDIVQTPLCVGARSV
jgi:hypothetical protein